MKTKNKNWIRLTTSIVIISLLYQNILLAGDKHLSPKSNNKDEMQAVMICETIEKRAGYGKPIERIYLDDILKWAESSKEEFSGCRFETLPHEIRIYLASDNIMVRYFDSSKADSISGFKTKIIGPRLHRQIIHTHEPKALLAEKQDFKQPVIKKITPLSLLIIITASCLLISTFVFTFTSTLALTSGAKLLFSMDIVRLLPSLAALLGGFGIGLWILKQIEYGMDLLRKEPAYDLLSRIVLPIREKPKKPVKFTEYRYKVITNQPIEAITLGIKLSGDEIERLRKISSIEDNAHRYMLYYGTQVNKLAGIVTVKERGHGIISVDVEWSHHEGKRQLSEDFIVTELANRNPTGILFHSSDIDPEIIDRVLPNHSVADKKESARWLKEKIFSRLRIEDKGQYTFFAVDKLDFRERRRLYFGSFRFSSLWKMAEIDHWIYSFANGLFFALVFSSIFAHAEAVKVLASYSFFEEYINLILTVIVAPLAARSIAKVIRMRWDPVRSRHGRRGGEDTWLSVTQNMRMGWKMIGIFKALAYSRIFLSATSLLLIPAIGVVILGISSAYVYLSFMFLKLVSDHIINTYEERYYKEVSEVAILFNETAKREGYAENFHNIDSTSDILRELIYASSLLIGYGIFSCSILSPAAIPLAILAAIAMPISSFLVPTLGRDYKNYLKMWGKGFTQQSGGKVLLAEGVAMITNPDNPLVVHPRPVPITDSFSILPWVEQLGVVIECAPGHKPAFKLKNPKGPRAKKGRYILTWPNEKLKIELISREKPLDIRDITTEYKQDGGCIIRFYPKKSIKPSKGSPATLLQYMHTYGIFSNNPKKSKELAKKRRGNDSQRTIQRELKVLRMLNLVEGDRNTGYYLPDWLKSIKIEDIISENPELNIADPDKKQIEAVKRRIRSRSQTALFTMLNGVLRDFMPMVNASLVAVVLKHYPHKDIPFAGRLYNVIQRYSGLSALEKLQEFNRVYPDDFINKIPAIAAEANELKKTLSSEVGISATGQKLLELFQHDLAFTISVDNPDYIKEVMGSNPSLLNAQGLLIDTLGNTGEADYDKFSHIDKVFGAYPDVKNVFLVFDAASEIKKAREIADRLKKQGKHVHVIGVVYPMSSAAAKEALKSALRQTGYTGSIDLDTLNLPDQSFESLSKTLVDAGADIVLSGLSSDLSQVVELYSRDRDKTKMSSLTDNDQGSEMVRKIAAIEKFKKMYGQEILEKIRREECYRSLADRDNLDISILQEVIYETEMRFCEHILEHIVTILERANGRLGEKEKIFLIKTSMLYDIDETIGTEIADRWHIRPSIPFLFRFLKDNFNIRIGIASTRSGELLSGLAEIADFIETDSVYNIPFAWSGSIGDDLLFGRFNQIFPGFKVFNPQAVLREFGWDDDRIRRFINDIGQEIFYASNPSAFAEERFRKNPVHEMLASASFLYREIFGPDSEMPSEIRSEWIRWLGDLGIDQKGLEELAEISKRYNRKEIEQIAQNEKAIIEFSKKIARIIGVEDFQGDISNIIIAAYRLAAAKEELDKGKAEVSVVIDDMWHIAEGFYELFIGKRRGPDGEDGYTLFNLERYRDRLFIFSTGKYGMYLGGTIVYMARKREAEVIGYEITKRFIETVKTTPEKTTDRKILLALDTDIGNMTQFEIDELLKQIKDVSSLLGDIEFVAGTGDTLTGLIEDAKSRIKTDNIDVVVVTKREKKNFDSSYHVVRADDSGLDSDSYVPILELLTFALLINLGDNDILLREIYKEITGNELTSELKEQIKNGISAIPLPPTGKIPFDFYNTSIEVLQSA